MSAIILDNGLVKRRICYLGVVGVDKDGGVGVPDPGCDGSCQHSVQEWFAGRLQLQLVCDT